MQAQLKTFFAGAGERAIDQLPSGAGILITVDESSYVLTVTDEREIVVEKGPDGQGELEIKGKGPVLNDLFSSPTYDEFSKKMISYKLNREAPEVRILLERTVENAKKFNRCYNHFLRRMYLL